MSKLSEYATVAAVTNADLWPLIQAGDNAKATTDLMAKGVFNVSNFKIVPAPATNVEVQAAVDALSAAGGGSVLLGVGTYTYSAPVVCKRGVRIIGHTAGGVGTTLPGMGVSTPTYGNVILGSSTSVDLYTMSNTPGASAFADLSAFINACTIGISLQNMHLHNCRHGIDIGAKWTGGPFLSVFSDLAFTGFSGWAARINNFGSCQFNNLYAAGSSSAQSQGCFQFGALQGTIYNNGNSEFRQILADTLYSKCRGIVFVADYGSKLNHINVFQLQCNQAGALVSQTFTTDGVTNDLTITTPANIGNYPLDFPLIVTTSNGNLVAKKLYFVVYNDGVSKIRISELQGAQNKVGTGYDFSTNVTSPGVATTFTVQTQGWPNLEVVGMGHNLSSIGIQSFNLKGCDLESTAPTCMFIQWAGGEYELVINESDVGTMLLSSTISARKAEAHFSAQNVILDFDQTSAKFSYFHVAGDLSDGNYDVLYKNDFVPGAFYSRQLNGRGYNVWGGPANGYSGFWINGSGQVYLPPQIGADYAFGSCGLRFNAPIAQRTRHVTNTSETFFNGGNLFWRHIYQGAANGTRELPSYSGKGSFFSGDSVGQTAIFINNTTFKLTINASAGENFNFNASETSWIVQPGGVLEFTLGWNGSVNSWVVLNSQGANPNNSAGQTFTPVCTAMSNLDSVTTGPMIFCQVGQMVMCQGRCTVDPTTAGSSTTFRMTLPISVDITSTDQAFGLGVIHADPQGGAGSNLVQISGNVTPDAVLFTFFPDAATGSQVINYSFSYQLK